MKPLTERQITIIKAIVEEYSQTAQPVGSETIDKKYNIGVSPATIRNEMVRLEDLGYLAQPHTSAGRVPTPKAIKLYITELLREQELPVTEEIKIKERIWSVREDIETLLKEVVTLISEKTKTLGLAVTQEGEVYSSGYANILSFPEFFDIDTTKATLSIIEMPNELFRLLHTRPAASDYYFLIGDDLPSEHFQRCAVVYTDFDFPSSKKGYVGVFGPARLNYSYTIPLLKHLHSLFEEVFGA